MKLDTELKYIEEYLPTPRHRKLREREASEPFSVEIKEATSAEAPVVLRTHDLKRYCDGIQPTDYRQYNGSLYTPLRLCDMRVPDDNEDPNMPYPIDRLHEHFEWKVRSLVYSSFNEDRSRDAVIEGLNSCADRFLLIDGVLWETASEPMYKVCTFGLGHNHGGTALMITNRFNENCPWTDYFTALQHDEAVAEALRVAEARGDTEYLDFIRNKKSYIEVLDPSAVKANPREWGGEGNELLNTLNAITSSADSTFEAGITAIAAAAAYAEKKEPVSCEDKINDAKQRAGSAQPVADQKMKEQSPEH